MEFISALSLTTNVIDWLTNSNAARILHVFDHACNLINEQGEVLSIVTSQIGDGPFHLVMKDNFLFSEHIDIESSVSHSPASIRIRNVTFHITGAKLWNPSPGWSTLYTKRNHVLRQLEQVSAPNHPESNFGLVEAQAPRLCHALIATDVPLARMITHSLAGLGPGLTPSGDDFIIGALHAAWIIHPYDIASKLANEVVNTAAPLTTSLSAAWLRSAGRGEAGSLWHEFFEALISPNDQQVQSRIDKILATGATSGADALAGFIGTLNSYVEFQREHVIP